MSKDNTTETKVEEKAKFHLFTKNNLLGFALLLCVISIGYSSTIVILGMKGIVPLIMIAPQTLLAIVILIWKFTK